MKSIKYTVSHEPKFNKREYLVRVTFVRSLDDDEPFIDPDNPDSISSQFVRELQEAIDLTGLPAAMFHVVEIEMPD